MTGHEGAVKPGGGLGEFDWRQLEKPGGGADEPGGDVSSATGAFFERRCAAQFKSVCEGETDATASWMSLAASADGVTPRERARARNRAASSSGKRVVSA